MEKSVEHFMSIITKTRNEEFNTKLTIILSISLIFWLWIVQTAEGSAITLDREVYPYFNTQFRLGINVTAQVQPDGPQITILDIQDSRCPSDVTCIWEGEAKVLIDVVKDGQDLGNFNLTSRAGEKELAVQSFEGFSIRVVKVDPYPISSKKILPSDYVVTLVVPNTASNPLSPLKQFKSGITLSEIKCKPSLQLVIKLRDGSPACIKSSSVARLAMQGWVLHGKSTVTLTEGQRDGPLLLQKILADHIDGLNFIEYPLARENGLAVSLKIGESASNGCTITLTLEKIDDKTATFSKIADFGRPCPIC